MLCKHCKTKLKSGNLFCSNKCKRDSREEDKLLDFESSNRTRIQLNDLIRVKQDVITPKERSMIDDFIKRNKNEGTIN